MINSTYSVHQGLGVVGQRATQDFEPGEGNVERGLISSCSGAPSHGDQQETIAPLQSTRGKGWDLHTNISEDFQCADLSKV